MTHPTGNGKIVHFPRHLSRLPKELDLPQYLERKYEATFQEPWSVLEYRVRARHPEFFALYDAMGDEHKTQKTKKWWQIWK